MSPLVSTRGNLGFCDDDATKENYSTKKSKPELQDQVKSIIYGEAAVDDNLRFTRAPMRFPQRSESTSKNLGFAGAEEAATEAFTPQKKLIRPPSRGGDMFTMLAQKEAERPQSAKSRSTVGVVWNERQSLVNTSGNLGVHRVAQRLTAKGLETRRACRSRGRCHGWLRRGTQCRMFCSRLLLQTCGVALML
jgi:hypothetical protein